MRVLLIRHAHAGVRGSWPGDDLDRELSDRGRAQVRAITSWLLDVPITAVHSSRAVRCVDTVRPLADRLELPVVETPQLLEGTDPAETVAWLEDVASADGSAAVAACSHGDVIGGVIELLAERGTPLVGDLGWAKASTWELTVADGTVLRGRLHEAPTT